MALFEHPDYDQHEKVSYFQDPLTGLKAIIAVHNTNLGASLGGCRMWPYSNSEDALKDVLRLSQGMSYKAAMAGLAQGGGKAVIIGDPRKHKTEALMQAMGRFVDSFNGRYIIAEDSGITVQDVIQMSSQTPYTAGTQARYSFDGSQPDGNPSPATAFGVFNGIQAAVKYRFGSDLAGKKIAIQGVGHVGLRLARHLYEAGAKLYVSDIYQENLLIAEQELSATIVDNNHIHTLDVDVYAPCALGGAINNASVHLIKAPIIAGAANNQLLTPNMADLLQQQDIVYIPDYVINAGGIIDIYHQTQDDSSNEKLREQLEQIGQTVTNILEKSSQQGTTTTNIANKIAEQALQK